MVRQHTAQPAFIGGEMSPMMLGRSDTERFLLGGSKVENFIARHQGPLVRRRGTEFIREDDCAESRLANFEFDCDSGSMLRFGCGTAQSGADSPASPGIPVTAGFEQTDGPFQFPPWLLTPPDSFDSGGERYFFRSADLSGTSKTKVGMVPNNPAPNDCTPQANTGLCEYDFGGGYQMYLSDAQLRDPVTGDPTPLGTALVCDQTLYGGVAPGNSGQYGDGTEIIVASDDFDSLLGLLSGFFLAGDQNYYMIDVVVGGRPQKQFVREYTFPVVTGFFATGYFRNVIWCPDTTVDFRWTNPVSYEDLDGHTVDRTGTAARTQTITNYNSGTRTYSGSLSTGVFSMTPGAGVTTVSGFYTFLVTPTVGDPYTVEVYEEYTVTPSVPNELRKSFPRIEDADVLMTAWFFSTSLSRRDTLQNNLSGETFFVAGSGAWSEGMGFLCPAPNTSAFDDFEDAAVGLISLISGGRGWVGDGSTSSVDRLLATDDFESYTVGTIYTLYSGVGWAQFGGISETDYFFSTDSFETYSVGSITVLDAVGRWAANGSTTVYDYASADDPFESYSVGSITVLNYSDPQWAANGSFI